MLLFLVVMRTSVKDSMVWYTYRMLSVSTNVCCPLVSTSFGNAARRPSTRDLGISMNCRPTRHLPFRLQIEEESST